VDLDTVADELYALSPEEFTAARTAREKEAKGSGDKELAAQIHALGKPNQAAWLANQLARQHGDELRPLLDLGAGLREAEGSLTGDQLRDFTRQKRQLVAALVQQARRLASRAGRKVSDDTVRGLEDTLNAGLADPAAAELLLAGRLSSTLQHTGFGPAGSADTDTSAKVSSGQPAPAPAAKRTGTRTSEEERQAQRLAAAERALEEAEAEAAEAEQALDDARLDMQHAEDAATEAKYEVERLQEELERAIVEQSRAEKEHRQLRKVFERADLAARGAGRRTEQARALRQRLLDDTT
jgi:hypothetical protein